MILNKIKYRLLLGFFLISPLPLAGLAWLYNQSLESTLQAEQLTQISVIADMKADEIDSYIRERLNINKMLARSNITSLALHTLSPIFMREGKDSPRFLSAERNFRNDFRTRMDSEDFYDVLLTDEAGNVVMSIKHEPDFGTNHLKGSFYNSSLALAHKSAMTLLSSQIAVTDAYAPSQNIPAIFLVSPVFKAGKVIGTVSLQLDLKKLTDVASDTTGLGVTGETVLAWQKDKDAIFVSPLKHIANAAFRVPVPTGNISTPTLLSLKGNHGAGIHLDYSGREVVAAWRYLPSLGWGMAVKIDTSEAFAAIYQLRKFTLIALGVLLFAALGTALLFGRMLVIPIHKLIAVTKQIATGDLNQRAPVTGLQELKQLSHSFNLMADQLNASHLALQARLEQITLARNEAERANAAKSEFLSRMSHELRTPLNAVLGFGQLLESDPEQPLTEIQADNLHEILQAGNHLLALVNEVLDLSSIENGKLEVNLEAMAIAPVIESCIAQLQPLAKKRHISVHFEQPAHYAVQADQVRLREVMLNLISNAVKYNRENGSIRILCAPSAAGKHLRISVQDTGRGIPADALPRLFKPFERLESAYNAIEGTGIGLALAKKLVEGMHGELGVESMEGKGSTFWFELPLAATATNSSVAATAQLLPAVANLQPYKILYIEDNPANLRLMHKIIATRKEIVLLDAMNAKDGLKIADSELPDLILLDIQLPDMNGFEAVRRLRANVNTRDITVIAVSANAMAQDIEHSKAAGFCNYITKPIDINKFFAILDHCLSNRTDTRP